MDPAAYEVVDQLDESHWFFVGRRAILSRLLAEYVQTRRRLTILDVGCGTGATTRFLMRYGEAIGIDLSEKALRFCRNRGLSYLCQGDALALPFSQDSFDILSALDLIEHLEDDRAALKEFWRVLKVGGMVVLFVPAFAFLWSDFDRYSGHRRRYRAAEVLAKVEEGGFVVRKLSYVNTVLFPLIWLVRFIRNLLAPWIKFRSDWELQPRGMNSVLSWILRVESELLRRGSLPFGASIVCIAEKEAL